MIWYVEGYDKHNIYNYCCIRGCNNKVSAIMKAAHVFNIIDIKKVYNRRS